MSTNPHRETTFHFKRFDVVNRQSAMKIGTDGVLLGAWASVEGAATAVDAGCGTGLIALMLAQRGVQRVTAVEIDPVAAAEADANVAGSPWADRVGVVCDDYARWVARCAGKVDLVVCNPPFFTETLKSDDSRRAAARHEGVLGVESLMRLSAPLLCPSGRLALIAPATREADVVMGASRYGLYVSRLTRVSAKEGKPPKRVLAELTRENLPLDMSTLYMRDLDNEFTDDYRRLTSEFYLEM